MKSYTIKAKGRESGAIGIFFPFTEKTQAKDEQEAFLNLYTGKTESGKKWEVISGYNIQES